MYSLAIGIITLIQTAAPDGVTYLEAVRLEQAGQYATAATTYAEIDASDEGLKPYAAIRRARCLYRQKKVQDAIELLHPLAAQDDVHPWTLMARAELGMMLADNGAPMKAIPLFDTILSIQPVPWWMKPVERSHAEMLLKLDDRVEHGYAWFRNEAVNTPYLSDRRDAARILLQSPSYDDKAIAVIALLRSGDNQSAGAALAEFFAADQKISSLLQWATKQVTTQADNDIPWLKLWLLYSMRTHLNQKHFKQAGTLGRQLLERYPEARETGESLWLLARRLEQDHRNADALPWYQRITENLPKHYRADDALWRYAHLLKLLGEEEKAFQALTQIETRFPGSRFVSQAQYYCAMMREKEPDQQKEYLAKAANGNLGDYYSHRARARLNNQADRNLTAGEPTFAIGLMPMDQAPGLPDHIQSDPRIQRMQFFGRHGLEEGEWEAVTLCMEKHGASEASAWYQAVAEAGFAYTAKRFADTDEGVTSSADNPASRALHFPKAYWPIVERVAKENALDPYLILALAKQESTFRATIKSNAGATGVMQLMPSTAKWMKDVDKTVTREHIDNLTSPQNSLHLGARYLARMVERSDGNLVYALASYNAGPGNCNKWKKTLPHDMDGFIENIPFTETRDYVKHVLGNYAAYRSLYTNN